jgi:hypothetical protein
MSQEPLPATKRLALSNAAPATAESHAASSGPGQVDQFPALKNLPAYTPDKVYSRDPSKPYHAPRF